MAAIPHPSHHTLPSLALSMIGLVWAAFWIHTEISNNEKFFSKHSSVTVAHEAAHLGMACSRSPTQQVIVRVCGMTLDPSVFIPNDWLLDQFRDFMLPVFPWALLAYFFLFLEVLFQQLLHSFIECFPPGHSLGSSLCCTFIWYLLLKKNLWDYI